MTREEEASRDAILARLAESRAELRRVLEPQAEPDDARSGPRGAGGFPRSRTMQMLMSGRGLGAVGALAGGVLIARPVLAWRLIRLLPLNTVVRTVVARVVGAMRTRRYSTPHDDGAAS